MLNSEERAAAKVVYDGPIRSGGADSGFETGFKVKELEGTGLVFLDPIPAGAVEFYNDADYWSSRYGKSGEVDFKSLEKKLGREQDLWLERIGRGAFQERTVVDIGSGAGLFLDRISRDAACTVGVEMSKVMRDHMETRGHAAYRSTSEAPERFADVCVTFDVLEHAIDPLEFLQDAYRTLKDGGSLFVGVPNQDDFLKSICTEYLPFFYHKSHLFYFTRNVLKELMRSAGFSIASESCLHKYNFMNMVNWLKDAKPTGVSDPGNFDSEFEERFRGEIERQGVASHILIEGRKSS